MKIMLFFLIFPLVAAHPATELWQASTALEAQEPRLQEAPYPDVDSQYPMVVLADQAHFLADHHVRIALQHFLGESILSDAQFLNASTQYLTEATFQFEQARLNWSRSPDGAGWPIHLALGSRIPYAEAILNQQLHAHRAGHSVDRGILYQQLMAVEILTHQMTAWRSLGIAPEPAFHITDIPKSAASDAALERARHLALDDPSQKMFEAVALYAWHYTVALTSPQGQISSVADPSYLALEMNERIQLLEENPLQYHENTLEFMQADLIAIHSLYKPLDKEAGHSGIAVGMIAIALALIFVAQRKR